MVEQLSVETPGQGLHEITAQVSRIVQAAGRLVPESDPFYEHVAEGPDDMPSHIKARRMK